MIDNSFISEVVSSIPNANPLFPRTIIRTKMKVSYVNGKRIEEVLEITSGNGKRIEEVLEKSIDEVFGITSSTPHSFPEVISKTSGNGKRSEEITPVIGQKIVITDAKYKNPNTDQPPKKIRGYKIKTIDELMKECEDYGKQLNQLKIKYNHAHINQISSYLPGYSPYGVSENNASLIHSLVTSILLYYYSMDPQNCIIVNDWLNNLYMRLKISVNDDLLYDVENQNFNGCHFSSYTTIIELNQILITSVVENIIIYILTNWENIMEKYTRSGISGIGKYFVMGDGKLISICEIGINLVMDILGIENLDIIFSNDLSSQDDQYNKSTITSSLDEYYGLYPLNLSIFNYENNYYGVFLSIIQDIPPVPVMFF